VRSTAVRHRLSGTRSRLKNWVFDLTGLSFSGAALLRKILGLDSANMVEMSDDWHRYTMSIAILGAIFVIVIIAAMWFVR
jgi:hypothetical protein